MNRSIIQARFKGRTLTKEEISLCTADPDWQLFRLTLKFIPLPERLELLEGYWNAGSSPEDKERRHVRIINYLNALHRAGMFS